MKIRTTISLYLGPLIVAILGAIFFLNYALVHRALTTNALNELAETHRNMQRASQVLLSTAINNYLRGITEKNIEFIEEQYRLSQSGVISKQQAKERVRAHFSIQSVGESGYLAAVEERGDRLYLDLHPYLPETECTDTRGCRAWARTRNGYTEYDWKNPDDNSSRKKAAYVQEFEPWNWIVGASSYRDEFVRLVKVKDLRKLIGPVRINTSGYFFLFDDNGTILIHPEFQDFDGNDLVNSRGENIMQLLRQSDNGYLTYYWKNPSEEEERLKYAFIGRLEDYNWYLVATGYLSEVYRPIAFLKPLTISLVLGAVLLLLLVIYRLSRRITQPLAYLRRTIDRFYAEKTRISWEDHRIDEINVLGRAFAKMTGELTSSMNELRQTNRELALSEKQNKENRWHLDSIIASMPSVIIGIDAMMRVTLWNSKAAEASGVAAEKALGRNLFLAFADLASCREVVEHSLAGAALVTHSFSLGAGDGRTRYFEMTVSPLKVGANEGAVIRIDDISERIEMDQRLRHSQKMDAMGQLAGGIAHDFNNMLSGISGAAELLRTRVGAGEQKLVSIITEASGRTAELIAKLLAFSRKEAVTFAPVNVHTVIGNTAEILRRSLDKRITLETSLRADSAMVYGDWSQLQSCLLNIGINAGHAMPDGGRLCFISGNIVLDRAERLAEGVKLGPGRYLQLEVCDTGCGIPKEHMKKIFEPFFTTRKKSEGTGLGLAAVYGAVQQHNGAISVRSKEGKGTCFILYLPLIEASEKLLAEEEVLKGEGCVLVVDDEPVVRETAKMMLERLGYTTLDAEDGRQALEVYREHGKGIDLVLLDMVMPVMDGTECFYQLKRLDGRVRVVITSGFTRDADLGTLKSDGLIDFMRKPFGMEKLSKVVARAMQAGGPVAE